MNLKKINASVDMDNQLYFVGLKKVPTTLEVVLNQVPDSWRSIVENLINDLFECGWNGEIEQIKEKFGELRFYINQTKNLEAIYSLITEAELLTESICIMCGEPATTISGGGWYTHRCETHKDA
jgi:hypothetical protein